MNILQIVEVSLVAVMLILAVKKERPEFAVQITLTLTAIIFLLMLGKIQIILTLFKEMAEKASLNYIYLQTIMKMIGIAYITEFGAQVCRDAGEGAIANKVEFAGKILILVIAVPILVLVLNTIIKLIP